MQVKFGLVAAFAGLCFGGAANAGTIMQTQSFGPSSPDFTSTLTFNQYNGNLADLISIKVKVEMNVTGGSATVDNDGEQPGVVDVTFATVGGLSSADVTLLDNAFQPVAADVSVGTNAQFMLASNDLDPVAQFNDDGGPDNGYLPGIADGDMSMGFINPLFFADFVGGGTFDIDFDATTMFSITGASGVAGAFVPALADGNVMITYEFIPTPGTLALAGLGLMAAARRRR